MGVVCYQRRSGKPGQRPGSLRHREQSDGPRRRQALRPEQIHGTYGSDKLERLIWAIQ